MEGPNPYLRLAHWEHDEDGPCRVVPPGPGFPEEQRLPRTWAEHDALPDRDPERIPPWVRRLFDSVHVQDQAVQLPSACAAALMPFQREAVERAVRIGGRILIADEMGLGKSLQSIAILQHYVTVKGGKALVLCKPTLVANWRAELSKWAPQLRCLAILKPTQKIDLAATDVVVVSFDTLKNTKGARYKELVEEGPRPWTCIVLDESHEFGGHTSQRVEVLTRLLTDQARHVVLLSGTPMPSRRAQILPQLRILFFPADVPAMSSFGVRYCGGAWNPAFRRMEYKDETCTPELVALLGLRMVRRTADVLEQQLPPLARSTDLVRIPAAELEPYMQRKAEYAAAVQDLRAKTEQALKGGVPPAKLKYQEGEVRRLYMALYHATAAAKAPHLADYVRAVHDKALPHGTIVFFHHHVVRDALLQAFPDAVVVDGATPVEKRQALVDAVARGEKTLALLSLTACCAGLNITPNVVHVVFAELGFVPALLRQAEKRAHRIGAVHPVHVTYLIAPGTLDDGVMRINLAKFFATSEVLGDKRARFDFHKSESDIAALRRLGVWTHARHVGLPPRPDEDQAAYLARVSVALDWPDVQGLLPSLDRPDNPHHETEGRTNLCETQWTPDPPPAQAFLITSLDEAELMEVRALPSSLERVQKIAQLDAVVCAVFV